MYNIENRSGEIYIDGKRLFIPRDADFAPVSLLFGLDPTGGSIPLKIDADGTLATSILHPTSPTPLSASTSQNLASDPLSFTTAIGAAFKIGSVMFHVDIPVTETFSVILNALEGYSVTLGSISVASSQDAIWFPDNISQYYLNGDEIEISCTNDDATGTVYAAIRYEL